jgi:hypothetical protein
MTPAGIAMARLYALAALSIFAAVLVQECGGPATAEVAARVDMLELRMESRDDAIEMLLWLAENGGKR